MTSKREDLQGIRGLAIISVLGFHFFPKLFPNGYVGVDVFFVLSGFLMTMIFGSKTINMESVRNFYYRRVKRILPLYLLIIFIGALSIFIFFPPTFLSMNMEAALKSILLTKNLGGGGGSDENNYFKMLNQAEDLFTHTWSLCVEMQFYLLAPGIFWILSIIPSERSQKPLAYYHIALIILSLVYQLLSSEHTGFNSVFSRLWQFLSGSGAFFLGQWLLELDNWDPELSECTGLLEPGLWGEDLFDRADEIVLFKKSCGPRENLDRNQFQITLSASIFSLIGISLCFYSIPAQILRVFVTFLTVMVIVSGTIINGEDNFMANRFLVYIGDISYSLYLVHWPVFVFFKTYYPDNWMLYTFGIFLSVLSAMALSEKFEKWYLELEKRGIFVSIAVGFLMIGVLISGQKPISNSIDSVRFYSDNKVYAEYWRDPGRTVPTLTQAISINRKWARDEYKNLVIPSCFPNSEHGHCKFSFSSLANGTQKIFIIGNSYAPNFGQLVFETFGKRHGKSMEKFSWSKCESLVLNFEDCKKPHSQYFQEVTTFQPDVLFILERPVSMFQAIQDPLKKDPIFQEALTTLLLYQTIVKSKIYILGAISPSSKPTLTKYAKLLSEGVNVTQETFEEDSTYTNALKRQEELIKRCPKCQLIPISPIFHPQNGSTKMFDSQTKLGYFYDGLHLTPAGLELVKPVFQKVFEDFSV